MLRKIFSRLAPLLAVPFVYAGCASNDGAPSLSTTANGGDGDDDLTADESAAGAAWSASASTHPDQAHEEETPPSSSEAPDDEELGPAPAAQLTTPEEDSTPFLDNSALDENALNDIDGEPLPPLDEMEIKSTSTCRKATGYRYGSKLTICVTTVNGKLVEVNTARAYLRMRKAAAKRGAHLYIVSGFRTMAQQRYLYHCYKTKACNGGNLAAPPGYSNHQSGHALDLNTSAHGVYSYLAKHGSTFRFKRTVPSEAWHWEHW